MRLFGLAAACNARRGDRTPDTFNAKIYRQLWTRPDRFSFQSSRIQKNAVLPIASARECRGYGASLWILQSNGVARELREVGYQPKTSRRLEHDVISLIGGVIEGGKDIFTL
jgi:hypothetical protein